MCQGKKEEEDLPEFNIVSMFLYNVKKTIKKGAEENWLQWPETIQTTQTSTEQK